MTAADDIVILLSERILQHALAAYAAEHFTHRVFSYSESGVTAAEAAQWFGISFVMHLVYGLVLGLIVYRYSGRGAALPPIQG